MSARNVGRAASRRGIHKSKPFLAGVADFNSGAWNGDRWTGLWHQFPAQMVYEFGRMHALAAKVGGPWTDIWPSKGGRAHDRRPRRAEAQG